MPVTAGDVWRVYVKPKAEGMLVFRKRNTIHTSSRVKAAQDKLKYAKDKPATLAHKECVNRGLARKEKKYIPNEGYKVVDVCPYKIFKRLLKKYMEDLHKTTVTE